MPSTGGAESILRGASWSTCLGRGSTASRSPAGARTAGGTSPARPASVRAAERSLHHSHRDRERCLLPFPSISPSSARGDGAALLTRAPGAQARHCAGARAQGCRSAPQRDTGRDGGAPGPSPLGTGSRGAADRGRLARSAPPRGALRRGGCRRPTSAPAVQGSRWSGRPQRLSPPAHAASPGADVKRKVELVGVLAASKMVNGHERSLAMVRPHRSAAPAAPPFPA